MWKPGSIVGDREVIGRRIFGDAIFDGKLDQDRPRKLRVDHFVDKQLKNDLSVDRLGSSGNPEKDVVSLLTEVSVAEGERRKPRQTFKGWGGIRVRTLRECPIGAGLDVIARPTVNPDNQFHAEITRDNFRLKVQAYALAHVLRDLVEKDCGFIARPLDRNVKSWRATVDAFAALCITALRRIFMGTPRT